MAHGASKAHDSTPELRICATPATLGQGLAELPFALDLVVQFFDTGQASATRRLLVFALSEARLRKSTLAHELTPR